MSRTSFRATRPALLAAFASVAIAATPAALAQQKLVFNNFFSPKQAMSTDAFPQWLAEIEKATEGRVRFEIPPTSLAPPPEQLNIVAKGVADGALIFNTFLRQSVKSVQIALLPLANVSAEADAVALWRTYQQFFASKNEYEGVVLVGFVAAPAGTIATGKDKPITTVAQLRNMKLWTLPGVPAQAFQALGAVPVPGPAMRSYEIVSKGTVDGFATMNYETGTAVNIMQYARSITELDGGAFGATFSVIINKAKWDAFSPADQKAIMSVSGERLARRSRVWDAAEQQARKAYLDSGRQILPAPPAMMADIRKAWSKFEDDWTGEMAKMGVDGKAALAFYKAEQKKAAAGN